MCPCSQTNAESLMDGNGFTTGLNTSSKAYSNALSDTATTDNPWAIDGKAPWSRGERLIAAVGSGLIVGSLAFVMVRKNGSKRK